MKFWVGDPAILAETSETLAAFFGLDEPPRHVPYPFEREYIARRIAAQYGKRREDFDYVAASAAPGQTREAIVQFAQANGEHPYTFIYGMPGYIAEALSIETCAEMMFACQLGEMDPKVVAALREWQGGDGILPASRMTLGTYASVPTGYKARRVLCSQTIGTTLAYPLLRAGVPLRYLRSSTDDLAAAMLMGVPADYAATGLQAGLDPDTIDRYYQEGVAAEYLSELARAEE